jgi:hypothetical protein
MIGAVNHRRKVEDPERKNIFNHATFTYFQSRAKGAVLSCYMRKQFELVIFRRIELRNFRSFNKIGLTNAG